MKKIKEIREICFDLEKAIKAARYQGIDYKEFISECLEKLKPIYFHISGGNMNSTKDEHLNLCEASFDLKWIKVEEYRLFGVNTNPLNPTGLMIIKKESSKSNEVSNPLICPITKTPLKKVKGSYFAQEGMLVYPIIDGVPCLMKENAIIATHYADNFSD